MTIPDAFSLTRLFIAPNAAVPNPTLVQNWTGGVMTQWDQVSFANTVNVGPVIYRNLPVISPNGLTEGTVLLANAPGGYIVMGMLGSAAGITLIDPIRYRSLRADVSSPASSTSLVNAGNLNFLLNQDTQYAVDGCLFYNSGTSTSLNLAWNGPPNMVCKWSNWGTQDTSVQTHLLFDTMTAYGDGNSQETYGWGHSAVAHPKGWFSTTDTPGILQLRFGQHTSNAAPAVIQQGSWMRIAELGSGSGTQTYVGTYQCTGSMSYDHNGNYIGAGDGDNNMYVGQLAGRSFGNELHMWTFNGPQIRTDLIGASVLSAQMFLYCFACSSSQGDYLWYFGTETPVSTPCPHAAFGGSDVQNVWTPGNWGQFDISSQITNIVNGGANCIFGGPASFGDTATAFRGYGYSVSYRPFLQITYSK